MRVVFSSLDHEPVCINNVVKIDVDCDVFLTIDDLYSEPVCLEAVFSFKDAVNRFIGYRIDDKLYQRFQIVG